MTYGSPGVLTTGTISGSHTYTVAGDYTVTITVGDGQSTTSATFIVRVDASATGGLGCYPTATAITGISNDTNGSSSSGATTSDPRLVLEGTSHGYDRHDLQGQHPDRLDVLRCQRQLGLRLHRDRAAERHVQLHRFGSTTGYAGSCRQLLRLRLRGRRSRERFLLGGRRGRRGRCVWE